MAQTQLAALLCSSLLIVLMASFPKTDASVGVCYGDVGNDLPPAREVIDLYKQKGIQRMRIYYPKRETLEALRGSNIELLLDLPNVHLKDVASSQASADNWVQNNVLNYGDVRFKYIAVGNEVKPKSSDAEYVVPAMENIQNAINKSPFSGQIKVSTAVDMATVLSNSYPPSKGTLNGEHIDFIEPVIGFLVQNKSPLLANLYTYYSYIGDPTHVSLDYALFRSPGNVVHDPDTNLGYQNVFDATLDALYSALEKAGGRSLNVVISETGWPSAGGTETTVENARTYNTKLIEHVERGTPKRSGNAIEAYIFALFDENDKPGDTEKHWGLFSPSKQPKYPINFN